MTPTPHQLRNFNGSLIWLVVEEDKNWVVVLWNRVSFIHAEVRERAEFEKDYQLARLVSDGVKTVLRQFRGYANSVGMTPEAAVYLPKLAGMPAEEITHATTLGLATQQRIHKEALKMAQAEGKEITGKAPRKLGGAAAAAVERKQARLAAEAKILAGQVSEDQKAADTPEVADAKLPKASAKAGTKKDSKKPAAKKEAAKPADKGPAIAKTTPKAKDVPKILNGKVRSHAQVSADGEFDPAKLKNSDGDYKSASAMFKGMLFEGKLSDADIAKQVDKKFSLGEAKAKDYVKWNRGWFRRQGVKIADAK